MTYEVMVERLRATSSGELEQQVETWDTFTDSEDADRAKQSLLSQGVKAWVEKKE